MAPPRRAMAKTAPRRSFPRPKPFIARHFTGNMNAFPAAELDRWIVAQRPPKNRVDPRRPYHVLVERERSPAGVVEDVGTIFLTNRECPFRCLMCDLWRNTTDERVPEGAIVEQIDWGLAELARQSTRIKRLKLYNAGN